MRHWSPLLDGGGSSARAIVAIASAARLTAAAADPRFLQPTMVGG
jgi:hypothetical protein